MAEPEKPTALVTSEANDVKLAKLRGFVDAFRATRDPTRLRQLCGDLLNALTELLPGAAKAAVKIVQAIDRYASNNHLGSSEIIDALQAAIENPLTREWMANEFEQLKIGQDQILVLLARLQSSRDVLRPAIYPEIVDFTDERRRHEHFFGRDDILAELDATLCGESGWLLLTGQPGVGKSAIINAWLGRRERAGLPTAFHFIRRNYKNWSDPAVVRANLAAQIERIFPEQRDAAADPTYRLEQLLVRVSCVLVERKQPLLLLVDGLDEAMTLDEKDNPIPRIFPLEVPAGVFVVIGSRPRYPKLNWFDRRSGSCTWLDLDARSESNLHTVRVYWEARGPELSPPLGNELLQVAVERARGNLLHAVKQFERWQRSAGERSIASIPHGFAGMLDELWERLAELPKVNRRRVHAGLALLSAARESLPLEVLEVLLGWEPGDGQDEFLPFARELLLMEHWHEPTAYRPFHEGFRELVIKRLPAFVHQSHETLVRFAAWPLEGDTFRRNYALRHRVAHQLAAKQLVEAVAACREVVYLTAKACALGILEVEREVRMVARAQEGWTRRWLETFAVALGSCSHWAREAPDALPLLLHDRLLSFALRVHRELTWSEPTLPNRFRLRHPLQNGGLSRVLVGPKSKVTAVAVLPDGRIVSGSDDHTLRIWDPDSGGFMELKGHQDGVTAVAVLSDGRIVSGSDDYTVRIWDLEFERSLVRECQGAVQALAVLPDGRIVSASTSAKDYLRHSTLCVWSPESDESLELECHGVYNVNAVAVLPDGRIITISDVQGNTYTTVHVWDLVSREFLALGTHKGQTLALAVLPDGRIVTGSARGTLRVWCLESGDILAFVVIDSFICPAALLALPDGRIVFSFGNAVCIWGLDAPEPRVLKGHQKEVNDMAALPDGRIVTGSNDSCLRIWDLESVGFSVLEGHRGPIVALAAFPDGRIVSGSSIDWSSSRWSDRTLRVWDFERGDSLALEVHYDDIVQVAMLPNGRIIAVSAEQDNRPLRVWDLESRVSFELDFVTAVAVLPDGRIVCGSWDGTLRVWNLETRQSFVLEGHETWVDAVVALPDGRIVSVSNEILRVWDPESGESLILEGRHGLGKAVAVLPDGCIVANSNESLRVCDLKSGESLVFEGHAGRVNATAVLPDGRIVSGSDDKTLRVWDRDSGESCIAVFGEAAFLSVAVVDQHRIVAGDALGNVWFLELPANL